MDLRFSAIGSMNQESCELCAKKICTIFTLISHLFPLPIKSVDTSGDRARVWADEEKVEVVARSKSLLLDIR